jgi:ribosomal protein L11 methyltransferase
MNSDITWMELSVKTRSEFVEPISELFTIYGDGNNVVEIDGGHNPDEGEMPTIQEWVTVKTYIPKDSEHTKKQAAIQAGVDLFRLVGQIQSLKCKELYETEWRQAYKKHIGPINIGKRIAIVPSWVKGYNPGSRIMIKLDPGLAFGTGHHPTTKMCLELAETLIEPDSTVLDLGCGSAILSIAAAKLGATDVTALDIDPQAIKAAEQNVQNNNVSHIVHTSVGILNDVSRQKKHQLLFANISSKVIIGILPEVSIHLDSEGKAILSGILFDRKAEIEKHIKDAGFVILETIIREEWVCFSVSKYSQRN